MTYRKTVFSIVLSLMLFLNYGCEEESDSPITNLFLSNQFLNIAHRGGGDLRPEETLIAFEYALEVGTDVLELDVHSTSDDVIVVMHDDTVDRTTDGSGQVHNMTFDAIRNLDAGYDFTLDGETYPYRGQGIKVPSLEEVLSNFNQTYMIIEIKQETPSIVDDVLILIEEYNMVDKLIIGSVYPSVNNEVRQDNPDVFTSYTSTEIIQFLGVNTGDDYTPPAQFMQAPLSMESLTVVNQEFMDKANHFGIKIHVWTINKVEDMNMLIDLGVDGIITDDPLTLKELTQQRGL